MFRLAALLAAILLSLPLAIPASAQAGSAQAEVVERLEDRFDVLELSDGWLLQPRDDRGDFRAIEIREGRVAVDGEWVDESELKRFVDADAALIFDLAEGRRPAQAAPMEAPSPPPAPGTPPSPEGDREDDRSRDEDRPEDREEREAREARDDDLDRVREQLEEAIERARRGEVDRELRDRLDELRDLEDLPREIDRLQRELERVIDRTDRRSSRRGRDAQVTLGSNLVVEPGEKVSEAVVISGDLDVLGEVDGDTTVVLGNARVEGFIDGTLVVVAGNIDVGPEGVIDGDAIAVGGAVRTDPGGHIDGEIIHLDFGELMRMGDVQIGDFRWPHVEFFDFGIFEAIGRIFRILFLAVLALLVYVLAGAKVEEVGTWVRGAPWRSLFSGLAVEIAFGPAVLVLFVLLCISVIGLLVACLLPPLALFVLLIVFLLGYTSVALSIGDWVARRFGLQYSNRYLVILVGMAVIEIWSVIGDMVGLVPFLGWIGAMILFAAWCFKFVIWTTGLGAAVLCQFSRDASSGPAGSDWTLPPKPPQTPPPAPSGSSYGAYENGYGSYDQDGGADDAASDDPASDDAALDDAAYEEDRDYPLLQEDDIRGDDPDERGEGEADRDQKP